MCAACLKNSVSTFVEKNKNKMVFWRVAVKVKVGSKMATAAYVPLLPNQKNSVAKSPYSLTHHVLGVKNN
jgi:hypothetical protein